MICSKTNSSPCRILAGFGFDVYNFSGGYRFYEAVSHDRTLIQQALDCGMDKLWFGEFVTER